MNNTTPAAAMHTSRVVITTAITAGPLNICDDTSPREGDNVAVIKGLFGETWMEVDVDVAAGGFVTKRVVVGIPLVPDVGVNHSCVELVWLRIDVGVEEVGPAVLETMVSEVDGGGGGDDEVKSAEL